MGTLKSDIDQLVADAALVHTWANGDAGTTVQIAGVPVRSPSKLISDKDAEITQGANNILAQCSAQATLAQTAESGAQTAEAAAQAAASAAQAAQSAVEAAGVNPAIRINPNRVTANFTIPADYNAISVGPLEIADGVVVTVSDNATWRIE